MSSVNIRISRSFHFEMAHALYGYDGPCKNVHGHSYRLKVVVLGKTESDNKSPKWGMVMDYSELKKIVEQCILTEFDHALVINELSPHKKLAQDNPLMGKLMLTKYQPTCENLLHDFVQRLKIHLPDTVKLVKVKLNETINSFAEWRSEDNLS